jgi:hypothetical protein
MRWSPATRAPTTATPGGFEHFERSRGVHGVDLRQGLYARAPPLPQRTGSARPGRAEGSLTLRRPRFKMETHRGAGPL